MEIEHKIMIDCDPMAIYNLILDLDNVLKEHGIRLEVENIEHDGYDVCVVKINK